MQKILVGLASFLLAGCMGMPKNVTPVEDFELNKYLGEWYEIARLDHSFERGLSNISATYSIRDDGGVKVVNRGYSVADKNWKIAEGKAYFVQGEKIGHLKVSFFGPFYSSYVIFELDKKEYQYAFISGYKHSYLWLLARTPTIDEKIKSRFVDKARELGFNTDKLIFVDHGEHK
ncbi:MAG: lipocalin family protein [Desulfuromonadaceae bacterium]|nr:lipocalin family protein [Desulfuromonadaceae bacterium]